MPDGRLFLAASENVLLLAAGPAAWVPEGRLFFFSSSVVFLAVSSRTDGNGEGLPARRLMSSVRGGRSDDRAVLDRQYGEYDSRPDGSGRYLPACHHNNMALVHKSLLQIRVFRAVSYV